MVNEFLMRDDRLANAFGRPIRGFPWWKRELTPQMWLMLHTGWFLGKPMEKMDAICHVIARPETTFEIELRKVAILATEEHISPRLVYSHVKLACINGDYAVKSTG